VKIHSVGMGYGLVRVLTRWVLALFYRRIDVVGLEHIPESGPLIVAANHQNALVDPMLLLALVPRRLVAVAKAPLFGNPVIGPLLRLLGALPVHRRQDGNADPDRNRTMFAAATAHLSAGGAVLIFPEGVSQPEPALMPLRSGAARMLLEAEAALGGRLRVALVPVGLVYHEPGTFRAGRAFLQIGASLITDDLVELHAGDPEGAAQLLTERLAAALRREIVESEDRETHRLLTALESITRADAPAGARDAAARAQWMRGAMRAYRYLREREPWRVLGFRAEVERYLADLGRAGLSDRVLTRRYEAGPVTRYVLHEGASLLVALPLAAWGIATHFVPYELAGLVVGRLRPEPDEEATFKMVASVVFYPVCWLAEGYLVWRLGGPWLLGLFAALLVPGGFFAIAWRDRVRRVGRDTRGFLRLVFDQDLRRRLAGRRAALLDDLELLTRLVPAPVLAGPERPAPEAPR
jgi:glycerol-3-phosphate O-acyltransferase / dihydroxyacetone phosphate acyltransferase